MIHTRFMSQVLLLLLPSRYSSIHIIAVSPPLLLFHDNSRRVRRKFLYED